MNLGHSDALTHARAVDSKRAFHTEAPLGTLILNSVGCTLSVGSGDLGSTQEEEKPRELGLAT